LLSVGVAAVFWAIWKARNQACFEKNSLMNQLRFCIKYPTGLIGGQTCRDRRTQSWSYSWAQSYWDRSRVRCSQRREAGRCGDLGLKDDYKAMEV
jgi:hypothetical protein